MDVRLGFVHDAFDVVAASSNDVAVVRVRNIHLHDDSIALGARKSMKISTEHVFHADSPLHPELPSLCPSHEERLLFDPQCEHEDLKASRRRKNS